MFTTARFVVTTLFLAGLTAVGAAHSTAALFPASRIKLANKEIATAGASHDTLTARPQPPPYAGDHVLAVFRPGTSAAERTVTAARAGLQVDTEHAASRYFTRLNIPAGTHAPIGALVTALRRDPAVEEADPDYVMHALGVPDDPDFASQWYLSNSGQLGTAGVDIGAPAAWDNIEGGGITVAVLDSGVDSTHPDLTANILRNPDGTVVGYNAITGDTNALDDYGHGTAVAGVLGARGNNGIGISGVCQFCNMMPVKCMDANGNVSVAAAIIGLDWACWNGAQIVVVSWGGLAASPLLQAAIQRAYNDGVLIVAAAGDSGTDNDTTPVYPASYNASFNNVVSVAASTATDTLLPNSNYGRQSVNIAAPGEDIFTTSFDPTTQTAGYASYSGTSMSAPQIAGAVALAMARDSSQSPHSAWNLVWENALSISGLSGDVNSPGGGGGARLSVGNMLAGLSLRTYTIQGTVTLNGAPLTGVNVTAVANGVSGLSASTQADGSYQIIVPQDYGLTVSYTVALNSAGYTTVPSSYLVTVGDSNPGQPNVNFFAHISTGGLYSISGSVSQDDDGFGLPASGVTVTAGAMSTTTTGPSGPFGGGGGTFQFQNLAPGNYLVRPGLSGYTSTPASQWVTVGPNQTGSSFVLVPVVTHVIGGVVSLHGNALPGVTVVAKSETFPTVTISTPSGSDGSYGFTTLPEGSYTLTPALAGFIFTPPSYEIANYSNNPTLNFAASVGTATYSLSGTITLNGAGLPGVLVSAGGASATTANDGTYTIAQVPAGTQTVIPSLSGYTFTPASKSVSVNGNVTGVNFTAALAVAMTYSISGTVSLSTGGGLRGVTVTAGGRSASTASDGTYTITGVSSGTQTVTPSLANYTFAPASKSVQVQANVTAVNFIASVMTAPVSGTVSLSGGGGLPGVTVTAGGHSAVTAADGTYTITGVPEGNETATPTLSGYTFTPASQSFLVSEAVVGVNFTATEILFSISGQVLTGGVALPGVVITAGNLSATTGFNGAYTLTGVAPGSTTLVPKLGNYLFSPGSQTVNVSGNVSGINFTAALPTYSISGMVSLGGGGLAGVTVSAAGHSTTTGISGAYSLLNVPGGTQTVIPTLSGFTFSPGSQSVTLNGNLTDVNFTVVSSGGKLQVSASALNFGTVKVGHAASKSLVVSNASKTASLLVNVENPSLGIFTVSSGGGQHVLPPGAKVSVVVRCLPVVKGVSSAVMVLSSSDPANAAKPISMKVKGD